MGTADRDWYWQHRRPTKERWHPVVWAALVVALFFAGAHAHLWFTARQAGADRSPERTRVWIRPSEPEHPQARPPVAFEQPSPVFVPPAARTVAKCTLNGRITYSDSCSGATSQSLVVEAESRQQPQGLTDYQREMLRSADARIAQDAEAARADTAAMQRANVSNRGECSALAQSIRSLDAMARQPLSGYQQDDIRRRRQELTSKQFALRC
jgi:hypothetical protein